MTNIEIVEEITQVNTTNDVIKVLTNKETVQVEIATLAQDHLDVREGGTSVVDQAGVLDFDKSAFEITDGGSGVAQINVDAPTNEEVEDIVANLLTAGTNVHLAYDDSADILTISVPNENIEDSVANLLQAGSNINITYDDVNDTLTISTTAEASLTKIEDTDRDTRIDTEENDDEDMIRIYRGGSEIAKFNTNDDLDLETNKLLNALIDGGSYT